MRRLVAAGADQGQNVQLVVILLAQHLPRVVPEIGREIFLSLHLLGRAVDGDRHALELLLVAPEEEHVDRMVRKALDMREIRIGRVPVHARRAVDVDGAPVVGDDGVAQRRAHAARLAGLPRLDDDGAETFGQEVEILGRPHHVFSLRGNAISPTTAEIVGVQVRFLGVGQGRRGVGMRCRDNDLLYVEIGGTLLDSPAHLVLELAANDRQIARHEHRLVDRRPLRRASRRPAPWPINGSCTSPLIRVPYWPPTATGRSGVILVPAQPNQSRPDLGASERRSFSQTARDQRVCQACPQENPCVTFHFVPQSWGQLGINRDDRTWA